ncbi:hypothetical protein O3Q51_07780 [Cryomorphaceae bacterium 1068]|nr:hypothetical protein [Cryomorphaceae bacterium 1068]
MNLKQLSFLLSLLVTLSVDGQSKTFVRDYTYRASDSDSKITSRQRALEEVKAFLVEELGTYVESYVNYEVEELNGKMTKDFFTNEIKTFSVGTTKTKILEEKWDGYEYYIRAEIQADPEEVLRRINETLSVRKKSLVIDSLKSLIKYSDVELENQANQMEELERKLAVKSKELNIQLASYNKAKNELEQIKSQLIQYQREEQEVNNEIEAIRQKVLSAGTKAKNFVRIGMTEEEVATHLGRKVYSSGDEYELNERARIRLIHLEPSRFGGYDQSVLAFYALGNIWIHFAEDSGLVDGVWEHDKMLLIEKATPQSVRENLMEKYNIGKKLY